MLKMREIEPPFFLKHLPLQAQDRGLFAKEYACLARDGRVTRRLAHRNGDGGATRRHCARSLTLSFLSHTAPWIQVASL
jgi:hypothetical protein